MNTQRHQPGEDRSVTPFTEYPDLVTGSSETDSWWGELNEGTAKVLVIADQQEKYVREYLLSDSRVSLAGVAQRLSDACRVLRSTLYDVVLFALDEHPNDLRALLHLMDLNQPKARAVVILSLEDGAEMKCLYGSKVMGYLTYEEVSKHLVASILEVVNGSFTASPALSRMVLNLLEAHADTSSIQASLTWQTVSSASAAKGKTLSKRELEILAMVGNGHVTAGVAQSLGISATTVNAHMRSIFNKLGCRTRAQAIQLATQMGLFNVGEVPADRRVQPQSGPAMGSTHAP